MNKKIQQFVPFCLLLAGVLTVVMLFLFCKTRIEELVEVRNETSKANIQKANLQAQLKKEEEEQSQQQIKLKSLKPIYTSDMIESSDSLSSFGSMFDDIIRFAQRDGLLIRSIEYNMKPTNDPLYSFNADDYNACELKFFFVGTYDKMKAFLDDMNTNFEYLTSISNLNISAFQEDDNYLLISETITLYSEKGKKQKKRKRK